MKHLEHKGLTLANKVSIFRILGVPFFVLFLTYYLLGLKQGSANETFRWAALNIFILLALSDALDGYLARSRNELTRLGTILDPLADKALMVSALILLTRPSTHSLVPQFPVSFTVLVLSRECILVLGAFVIHHYAGEVEVRVRGSGKCATAFLVLAVAYALWGGPAGVFQIIIGICSVFILVSWAQYLMDGIRQIERTSCR